MSPAISPSLAQSFATYRLDPLNETEAACWDELITPYDGHSLFHRRAWLDYLTASRGVKVRQWAIRKGDCTVGYFCGGILELGPFCVLGSPLKSWGTNVMGPLTDQGVEQSELLRVFDRLAQTERLAMLELEHPQLSRDALTAAGFEPVRDWTYLVRLTPEDPQAMWWELESTCRNRIRKAERAGVTVEDTDDPAVADEFYDFYSDLMPRKGMAVPFPRATARLLVSYLKKADCLFALRAKDRSGRLLAVGLFLHDNRTMYFWNSASPADAHALCPNDVLHWTAMQMAARRGLRVYNMSGHGRFKRKFGGILTEVTRWHKCYWQTARWARKGYELWFRSRNTLSRWRLTLRAVFGPAARSRTRPTLPLASTRAEVTTIVRRPSFRLSDIYKAPLHDLPVRDELVYQYLPLTRDMEVLEAGPGSGFTAFRLARLVRSVTLLDVAPRNIAQLRSALGDVRNLTMVSADLCQPELAAWLARRFDAIYALEVFEYVPDPGTCIRNLAALLRPGGHLLLQFPNYPPPRSPGLTYLETKSELDRFLRDAGFSCWTVCALSLRPWAEFVYEYAHEKPIRVYRQVRSQSGLERAMTYDQTWVFQHQRTLRPIKYMIHASWAILSGLMRLGGPVFTHTALEDGILNRNLMVLARR